MKKIQKSRFKKLFFKKVRQIQKFFLAIVIHVLRTFIHAKFWTILLINKKALGKKTDKKCYFEQSTLKVDQAVLFD